MATKFLNTERISGMRIQSYQVPENAVPVHQQRPTTTENLGGSSIRESSVTVQLQKVSRELEECKNALEAHRNDAASKLKRAGVQLGKEKAIQKRRKIEELDAKIRNYREQKIAILDFEIETEYREKLGFIKRVIDFKEKMLSRKWTQKHSHLANITEQIGIGQ